MPTKITKSIAIGDLVSKHPEAAPILMSYGLHCIGCHASGEESLEQGCLSHGMSPKDIAAMVKDINEAILLSEKTPIILTKKAAATLKAALKEGKSKMVRIKAIPGNQGYTYDMHLENKKGKADKTVKDKGVTMVVDPESLLVLKGRTIDFLDGPDGGGFRVNNG
jgi:iron-sulfur cluster assembly accessory protein